MPGKRFNPRDRSTKAGGIIGGLSAVGLAVVTAAPEVANALTASDPSTAVKVTVAGLILGALLGAKRGR